MIFFQSQQGVLKILLPSVFLVFSTTPLKSLAEQSDFSSSDSQPPACRWAGFSCPASQHEDTERFLRNITNVLRRDIRSGSDLKTNRIQKLLRVINQGTDQQMLSLIRTLKKHPSFAIPKIFQAVFERVQKIKNNNLSFYYHKIVPALDSFRRFESFLYTSLAKFNKKNEASKRITFLAKEKNLHTLGMLEDIYGQGWKAKKLKKRIQADISKVFTKLDIKQRLNLTWDTNKVKTEALLVGAQLSNSFIVPFIKQAVEETNKSSFSRRDLKKLRNAAIQAAGDNLLKAGHLEKYKPLHPGDLTQLSDSIVQEGRSLHRSQSSSGKLASQVAEKIRGTKAEKYLNESGLFYDIMQTPSIKTTLAGNSPVSSYNTQFVGDQYFSNRTELIKEHLKNLFNKEPNELVRLQVINSSLERVGREFASSLVKEGSEDKNVDVRQSSMFVAKNLPVDQSIPILKNGLQDHNGFVQREAVKGIAENKTLGPDLLLNMYNMYEEDPNRRIISHLAHKEAMKAAGEIGGPRGIQLLQKGVSSKKENPIMRVIDTDIPLEVDGVIVESIVKIGPEGLRLLEEMYDNRGKFYNTYYSTDKDSKARAAIINAVGRINGPWQIKARLAEKGMLNSEDRVRVAAVHAISRISTNKTEELVKRGLADESDKVFEASMQVLNTRLAAGYNHLPLLRQILENEGGALMTDKQHRLRRQQRMGTIQNLINRYSY